MAIKATIPAEITTAHDLITSRITTLEQERKALEATAGPDDSWAREHVTGRIGGLNEALSLVFHALVETARPS